MNKLYADILISFCLIGVNACFVLTEYAMIKVRASRLEVLSRKGNTRAQMVQGILKEFDLYLSAIQMGITMTSLGLGWVGEPAVAAFLEGYLQRIPVFYISIIAHGLSFVVAFGTITFLHILLGELVPRSVGLQKAEIFALWAAFPLRAFTLIFKLPVTILANASMAILRLLRMPPVSQAEAQFSEEELRVIIGAPEERVGVPLERLMLIENVFDFGSAKVSDAMMPAEKVVYLSLARPWAENLEFIKSKRYSRFPLCQKGLESPIGYVHMKDLIATGFEKPDLQAIKRPLQEVRTEEPLQKLLQRFADKGVPIALVRDESGRTAGLVTLEDVLEELVGEIHDEFDLPEAWSLMDSLVPTAVEIGLELDERQAVIRRLVDKLKAAVPELNAEEAFRTAWERESKFSSAVGRGVALPHGRLPGIQRSYIAVGRAAKAFPFTPPDKLPVRLVFLILTPTAQPIAQLRILARVATLLTNDNLRRRLLRAKSGEQLVEILRTADTVLAA